MTNPDPLLTVEEVAGITRLAKATIYKLAATGELPSVKLRRRVLFRADELDAWIRGGGERPRGSRAGYLDARVRR